MDTIFVAGSCVSQGNNIMPMHVVVETGFWDIISMTITCIFAIANIIIAINVHKLNKASDEKKTLENKRISMLKTLFLDSRINIFYSTIDEIKKCVGELYTSNITNVDDKELINTRLRQIFYELNVNFVDLLMAINYNSLYVPVRDDCQQLQDDLTNAIFDEGICLNYRPKFEERILSPIGDMQIKILKTLYNYNGNVD